MVSTLDRTYIPILRQNAAEQHIHYNRKTFDSLNCQVAVSGSGLIVDPSVGHAGSIYEGRFWRGSRLKCKVDAGFVPDSVPVLLHGM